MLMLKGGYGQEVTFIVISCFSSAYDERVFIVASSTTANCTPTYDIVKTHNLLFYKTSITKTRIPSLLPHDFYFQFINCDILLT